MLPFIKNTILIKKSHFKNSQESKFNDIYFLGSRRSHCGSGKQVWFIRTHWFPLWQSRSHCDIWLGKWLCWKLSKRTKKYQQDFQRALESIQTSIWSQYRSSINNRKRKYGSTSETSKAPFFATESWEKTVKWLLHRIWSAFEAKAKLANYPTKKFCKFILCKCSWRYRWRRRWCKNNWIAKFPM